jgi:hypothetical protein
MRNESGAAVSRLAADIDRRGNPVARAKGGAMNTGIDWSTRPEPWAWIGPQFRQECEKLAAGEPLPPREPRTDIERRRVNLGVTRTALGIEAGYNCDHGCNTVSKIERGKRVQPAILARVSAALDRLEAAARQAQAAG